MLRVTKAKIKVTINKTYVAELNTNIIKYENITRNQFTFLLGNSTVDCVCINPLTTDPVAATGQTGSVVKGLNVTSRQMEVQFCARIALSGDRWQ